MKRAHFLAPVIAVLGVLSADMAMARLSKARYDVSLRAMDSDPKAFFLEIKDHGRGKAMVLKSSPFVMQGDWRRRHDHLDLDLFMAKLEQALDAKLITPEDLSFVKSEFWILDMLDKEKGGEAHRIFKEVMAVELSVGQFKVTYRPSLERPSTYYIKVVGRAAADLPTQVWSSNIITPNLNREGAWDYIDMGTFVPRLETALVQGLITVEDLAEMRRPNWLIGYVNTATYKVIEAPQLLGAEVGTEGEFICRELLRNQFGEAKSASGF